MILIAGLHFVRGGPSSEDTYTGVFRVPGHHFCSFTLRVWPEIHTNEATACGYTLTSGEGYTLAPTVLGTFLKLETIQGKHSAR